MKKETELLWRQCLEEVADAVALLQAQRWPKACQCLHASVEYGLRAIYVEKTGHVAPQTHDLGDLAAKVDLPSKYTSAVETLNNHFNGTRGPSAGRLPVDVYKQADAEEAEKCARAVVDWLGKQFSGK